MPPCPGGTSGTLWHCCFGVCSSAPRPAQWFITFPLVTLQSGFCLLGGGALSFQGSGQEPTSRPCVSSCLEAQLSLSPTPLLQNCQLAAVPLQAGTCFPKGVQGPLTCRSPHEPAGPFEPRDERLLLPLLLSAGSSTPPWLRATWPCLGLGLVLFARLAALPLSLCPCCSAAWQALPFHLEVAAPPCPLASAQMPVPLGGCLQQAPVPGSAEGSPPVGPCLLCSQLSSGVQWAKKPMMRAWKGLPSCQVSTILLRA